MPIYGIYLKTVTKGQWHLFSISISAEATNKELETILKEEKAKGNDQAEVGCQIFNSVLNIPEYLREIKNQKPLYN